MGQAGKPVLLFVCNGNSCLTGPQSKVPLLPLSPAFWPKAGGGPCLTFNRKLSFGAKFKRKKDRRSDGGTVAGTGSLIDHRASGV